MSTDASSPLRRAVHRGGQTLHWLALAILFIFVGFAIID